MRVAQFAQDILAKLDDRSRGLDLYYQFIYIGDAGMGEDPFSLYGSGKSLLRMKAIRKKYDPSAMFQYL